MQRLINTLVTYRTRLVVAIALLAVALFGSNVVRAYTAAPAPTAAIMTNAVNTYLHENASPLADQVTVEVAATAADYARLSIVPNDPEAADLATAFARRSGDQWVVLSIGTAFLPEDCAALGLPAALPCE